MNELGTILLVEDRPEDIELTLAALRRNHIANEVAVARSGTEALDYLYRRGHFQARSPGHPLVVFLDLKMPKVDGLEVLQQMKSDPDLKSIPVVIVTSSRGEPELARSYQLGANAYVVKTVDFRQFDEAIRQLGMFWAVLNETPPRSIQRR